MKGYAVLKNTGLNEIKPGRPKESHRERGTRNTWRKYILYTIQHLSTAPSSRPLYHGAHAQVLTETTAYAEVLATRSIGKFTNTSQLMPSWV